MYYPHFGLREPPFKITPNTDFFFPGGNRGAVLDALVYAITNGEGIIKVVGEVGTGKTMLCRMLQAILPERIESIYLANPSVAPEDVLHAIAFELQLKLPKNADRLKVMQLLQTHLLNRHAEGRQVVIFVEEAQGMPLATLEEIRLLSNLETRQDKLLQIVLFGQPELDVNLSETHIRQLRERITHSFHLDRLSTVDIGEYLVSRLRAAGYRGPPLFSYRAVKKLAEAAEGLARRVNILADKALLAAFAENVYMVKPKHVKAAIQDSEFGRRATNYKQYLILAIALIACLAAFLGYLWWQTTQSNKFSAQNVVHQTASLPVKISPATSVQAVAVAPTANAPSQPAPAPMPSSLPTLEPEIATNKVAPIVQRPISKTPEKIAEKIVEIVAEKTPPPAIDVQQQLVESRFEATKSWLFSTEPDAFSLQIKSLAYDASTTGDHLKAYGLKAELYKISQLLDADKLFLYSKKQNGKTYHVIAYGTFSNRSEAQIAMKELSKQLLENKPYLRTLARINKEAE